MTLLSAILKISGLSIREASEFLSVRLDTVKSWSSGRNPAPPGVYDQLHALLEKQETAAGNAIDVWHQQGEPEQIELGFASDDHEARSLGWPCVGAQMAAFVRIWAMLHGEAEIIMVPRGTTIATAAAADVHDRLEDN